MNQPYNAVYYIVKLIDINYTEALYYTGKMWYHDLRHAKKYKSKEQLYKQFGTFKTCDYEIIDIYK